MRSPRGPIPAGGTVIDEITETPIVVASNLRKTFEKRRGIFGERSQVRAVQGVSFEIKRGQTLGLAGESGSGKSTLARLLLRTIVPDEGEVFIDGKPMSPLKGKELRRMLGRMPMVFQDPYASLDPTKMVLEIVGEPLAVHRPDLKDVREERVIEVLERVGLDPSHRHRYPYEFSGGQRQRVAIARALINDPDIIIADEPVSALDVSTQAQVLNLLDDLRRERQLAMLMISHDISVLRQVVDYVAIMFKGSIVEQGPASTVFDTPSHPYTKTLMDAVPRMRPNTDSVKDDKGQVVSGNFESTPNSCAYLDRCSRVSRECVEAQPELLPSTPGVDTACFRWQEA